jgi:hypothetical protein
MIIPDFDDLIRVLTLFWRYNETHNNPGRHFILTIIASGCMGPAVIKPVSRPNASVAYGNISLPENKHITSVMLYKVGEVYAPPFKSPLEGHPI